MIILTYPKVLIFQDTCQAHSVECVSKNKSILSIIFHAIYGAVCIQPTHFSYGDGENMCTLSYHRQSSNRKYDPFAIVRF